MPSSPKSKAKKLYKVNNSKQSSFSPLDTYRSAANKAGQAYGFMLRNQPLVRGAKTSAKVAETVAKGAMKRTVKDVQNVAQFSSKGAKGVIREAQGLAKMVMKGFGN